ncbi:MAG: hypothetical protein WBD31_11895 [Rubripirellula sp.]
MRDRIEIPADLSAYSTATTIDGQTMHIDSDFEAGHSADAVRGGPFAFLKRIHRDGLELLNVTGVTPVHRHITAGSGQASVISGPGAKPFARDNHLSIGAVMSADLQDRFAKCFCHAGIMAVKIDRSNISCDTVQQVHAMQQKREKNARRR